MGEGPKSNGERANGKKNLQALEIRSKRKYKQVLARTEGRTSREAKRKKNEKVRERKKSD